MTVKELIEQLKKTNLDAVVYVYADHGQTSEQAEGFSESYYSSELPYIDHDGDLFVADEDLKERRAEEDSEYGDTVTAIEIG